MSASQRLSPLARGRLMFDARRSREARDLLDEIEAERAAERTDDPAEEQQPRTPRPDPTQGARPAPSRGSGVDAGREMYAARHAASYDAI